MGHDSAGEITTLLQGWRDGDRKALDALVPIVYLGPHRLAHFQLRQVQSREVGWLRRSRVPVGESWTADERREHFEAVHQAGGPQSGAQCKLALATYVVSHHRSAAG